MRHDLLEQDERGIRFAAGGLYLDAHRKAPWSFVSHAHSDHIAPHARVVATRETIALFRHRRASARSEFTALVPGRPVEMEGMRVELFPAGHVLGAAQIRIERAGRSVVYTGDLSTRAGYTVGPAEVRRCDTLLMECTFGHPRYRFPPFEEVVDQVHLWARRVIAREGLPVLLAYSLGKAQEAATAMAGRGLRVLMHPDPWNVSKVYRALGVPLDGVLPYEGGRPEGAVLVWPAHLGRARSLATLAGVERAILTGWALDRGTARGASAEAAFPWSDHAGFDELVEYVERCSPREVLLVHGFTREFAQELRRRGFEARPLDEEALPLLARA